MKKPLIIVVLALFLLISLYKIHFIRSQYISNAVELSDVVLNGVNDYALTHEAISYEQVKQFVALADGAELAMYPINSLAAIAATNTIIVFVALVYFVFYSRHTFNKSKHSDAA